MTIRVPKAPAANVVPFQRPPVSDTFLMMAAAEQNAQGRLFEPDESIVPPKPEPKAP